jgi:hypothetical protein
MVLLEVTVGRVFGHPAVVLLLVLLFSVGYQWWSKTAHSCCAQCAVGRNPAPGKYRPSESVPEHLRRLTDNP